MTLTDESSLQAEFGRFVDATGYSAGNGRVERANRTARIEFWNFLDREPVGCATFGGTARSPRLRMPPTDEPPVLTAE